MQIHDTITADQIEVGDQIMVDLDNPIEVRKVIDSGDSILVTGFSYESGDLDTFIFTSDTEVGLWAA